MTTKIALVVVLAAAGCHLPMASNGPSADQQARADADASRACENGAHQVVESFCAKPPATVTRDYVDSAKSSRNSLAGTCKKNPDQMSAMDDCIAQLEAK